MKIAALVSGGVDSSVSLALLSEAGFDVTAFYLKIWLEDEALMRGECAWEEDLDYIEKTCKLLNVPLTILSLQREYWDTVVAETIAEVKSGLTPNPDIWCNEKIKFGSFYKKIPADFAKVATGHYAQVEEKDGKFWLRLAPDKVKDQTYFLSRLTQTQLSRAMFPIGHLEKKEVRALAKKFNLPSRDRPDSQGICFLGKFKFSDFLRTHVGEKPGPIIDADTGKAIGTHSGFWFHTIGQRQGLGLSGGPWFVVAKDTQANTVSVSRKSPEEIGSKIIHIKNCNWIPALPEAGQYSVKLRHGPAFVTGNLELFPDHSGVITLAEKQRGLAPGQSAVVYQNEYCLGGGIMAEIAAGC